MNRLLYSIGLCALVMPVWAGETIVLRNGFELSADRHEVDGATIRIFAGEGVTEMPANLVARVDTTVETRVEARVETPIAVIAAVPETTAPEAPPPAATPEPAPSPPVVLTPAALAETAARKYALPEAFVASVMRAESGFNAAAVSPKGAIGLMQLMPGTARDLGVDPMKPAENADAGTRYLRDLLARYEGKPDQVALALAAYNAGPAAVDKYHGVPPYRETREYILRVLKDWNPPSTPAEPAK